MVKSRDKGRGRRFGGAGSAALLGGALAAFLTLVHSDAFAGGYDTGERDWDFLFQDSPLALEAGTRYFNPQRHLTITSAPVGGVDETAPFSVERFSIASRINESLRCLASYREPWAGVADYGLWAFSGSATKQVFSSEDYGLTCAVSMPLEKGQLSFIGGWSQQEIRYQLDQFIPLLGPAFATDVSGKNHGWRAGLAYEIPEYALRASLIWNSQIDFDMTGSFANSLAPVILPIHGSISMPQSVEAKFQSGVAPGWLAFGSVKWTDWSVTDYMSLCSTAVPAAACNPATATSGLVLLWKDTWTVTVGAAHQFSETFSLAGNITWDQGASQGFTSQTDTWIAGLTAILTPQKNVELKFGGAVAVMTSGNLDTTVLPVIGNNPFGYTASFGNDFAYTLNMSMVFKM